MRFMSIDPGITTGFCIADLEHNELKLNIFQQHDDVDDLWRRLEAAQPRYIVIEDFEYRNRSRAGLVLFSVQLIGITRLYEMMARNQCSVVLQKAAQGKSYFTDMQLKNLGIYKRGVPHGMDATRHLLHWLNFGSGHQFVQGKRLEDLIK